MPSTQEFHTPGPSDDVIPNGGLIVERFGGIRPMASKLNVPVTTVQGWKKRDVIPAIRREEILNAARRFDVQIQDLVGMGANENTRARTTAGTGIEEDPALTRLRAVQDVPAVDTILTGSPVSHRQTPAPQPQPQPRVQAQAQPAPKAAAMTQDTQAPKADKTQSQRTNTAPAETMGAADLRAMHKSARRTSLATSAVLIVLAAGAAYLLFGPDQAQQGVKIQSLDGRVTALEQQARSAGDTAGTIRTLQTQVSNITSVIGTSAEGLAQLAREVAAGTNAPLTQRLAVLEAQLTSGAGGAAAPALSNLTDRIQAMAASPQGQAEWQAAIDDLRATVLGMQGRTDQMEGALEQARAQNDALGRTLSQVSGNDVGAAAMLLALTQLREAVDRQAPFEQDLELLKSVSSADPALAESLDKLAPHAQIGILSPQALKAELQAASGDIISAKLRGEDVSIKDKLMLHLKSLLSVRKNGATTADAGENALIQQASAQLDAGDVQGAMTTLQQLQGPAAEAAAPWQEKAQATLIAQTVDMNLVNAIIGKVKNGLSTMAAPASGLTGVVNSGPINMAPSSSAPQPALDAPSITQTPPAQGIAPMEAQPVPPGVQSFPRTEPQAGGDAPSAAPMSPPVMIPPESSGVTIQQ